MLCNRYLILRNINSYVKIFKCTQVYTFKYQLIFVCPHDIYMSRFLNIKIFICADVYMYRFLNSRINSIFYNDLTASIADEDCVRILTLRTLLDFLDWVSQQNVV